MCKSEGSFVWTSWWRETSCGVVFGEAVVEVGPWSLGSFRQAGYARILPLSRLLPWRLTVTFVARLLMEQQHQYTSAYCGY